MVITYKWWQSSPHPGARFWSWDSSNQI